MCRNSVIATLLLLLIASATWAQSNAPHSGVGKCPPGQVVGALNSNAPPTCVQAGGSGNLPFPPNTGSLLFSSSGAAIWQGFAAGSDLVASSTVPGQVNLAYNSQTCSISPCNITATFVTCNAASSAITLILPPASTQPVYVKSATTSNNTCTLQGQGVDLIDGQATLALPVARQAVQLVGQGAGSWGIVNVSYPVTQTFAAHNFVTGQTSPGVLLHAQPDCSDLTNAAAHCGTNASELISGTVPLAQLPSPLPASSLPQPTATTLGGVKSAATQPHKWINGIDTTGLPSLTQPDISDLTGIPLSIANGGTAHTAPGAATANAIGAAASGANNDITQLNAYVGPLNVSQGGTQCAGTRLVSQLPIAPVVGQTCVVTDAVQLQLGSAVTGLGSVQGPVTWNGTTWAPGGNATAPPGSVSPINQLPTQTGRYSANSQPIGGLPAPTLAGDAAVEGSPLGAITPSTGAFTTSTATSYSDSMGPVSTSGLVNDNNNSTTVAARNAANTADIIEMGIHADDTIHIGGPNSAGITLDSSSAVSQGTFSSGAYLDVPTTSVSWSGGTENCARNWHSYTVTNTAVLTLACASDAAIHDLHYRFYQPTSGSTFTYSIVAGNGVLYTALGGNLPQPCATNGCYDQINVTWEPGRNVYSARFEGTFAPVGTSPNPTCGPASSPPCFYFSTSLGNDSTGNGSFATPYSSISKAISLMGSGAAKGTQYLFKGNDIWTGNGPGGTNPPIVFDTTAHELSGTATNPMVISSYGGGQAVFDEANTNPYCFGLIQVTGAGTGNPPVGVTNQYFTINNIKCIHAYAQGVVIDPSVVGSPGASPGIIVSNMDIEDTGFGCSTITGACAPSVPSSNDSDPPDWTASIARQANSATHTEIIMPGGSGFWYAETVANCNSKAAPAPTFSQTVGGTTADGTCSWTTLGVKNGGYKNQLQYFASSGGSADGVQFIGNKVKWGGGHNLLEVQGDIGAMRVIQNTVGPGGVHGTLDFKDVGNATTSALVANNTATCGHSLLECGCDNTNGGSTCSTGPTPAIYTSNVINGTSSYITFQENVAYDSGVGYQMCPNGVNSGGNGPIFAKYYNNNAYVASTTGIYAGSFGCGNGTLTNSSVDLRNNIFDGGKILVDSGWTAGKMIEDYNDIGGAQGNVTFSVNGGTTKGAHDFCASGCARGSVTDPSYVNAAASPPNFNLLMGSVAINAGLTGLTAGNMDMGAF